MSGDYYITCDTCRRRWATINSNQPESGVNADGKRVGTDPSVANNGFYAGTLEEQTREFVPKTETS
jgi:hypothetical protein